MDGGVPAAFVPGPAAVEPAGMVPGDVLLGLLIHLWLGILAGLLYALLPRTGLSPVAGGLATGAVLYAIGSWALPLLFPAWLAPFWLPPVERALQACAHAAYGVIFGVSYHHLS